MYEYYQCPIIRKCPRKGTIKPADIPTYTPTYIPTYTPTYTPTYIPTYTPTYIPRPLCSHFINGFCCDGCKYENVCGDKEGSGSCKKFLMKNKILCDSSC